MYYQPPTVYEPTCAADLRRHYSGVKKRNRSSASSPIVVIRPAQFSYTKEQARSFMAEAHSLLCQGNPSLSAIIKAVSDVTKISVSEISADRRFNQIVNARHVYFYLARNLTTQSLPAIGRKVGGRDHTTVINGINRVERALTEGREPFVSFVARSTAILGGKRT